MRLHDGRSTHTAGPGNGHQTQTAHWRIQRHIRQQLHQCNRARSANGVAACQATATWVEPLGVQPQGLGKAQALYRKGVVQLDAVQAVAVGQRGLLQGVLSCLLRGQLGGVGRAAGGGAADPPCSRLKSELFAG